MNWTGLIIFLIALTALLSYDYGHRRGEEFNSEALDYWQREAKYWRKKANKKKRQLKGFADREVEQLNQLWEREDGEE